ncbi:hypothetical protein NADE_003981 [Nannochloris sp. 'desiccata']|nr:hypothetical protein NADE_003981 [Chlorella desiccata (nom. nud.)]
MFMTSEMYADDLMQAATSIDGLRKQMALLEDFSARWGLTINASKTKVMVFSRLNSPHIATTAVLKIGGEVVEPPNQLGSFANRCWHRHRELNPLQGR